MADGVEVTLPGGLWRDGACVRQAAVRPLDPLEERELAEARRELSAAELATRLLAAAVVSVGAVRADPRALSMGDREALLLHVRRLTIGERLPCVLSCPSDDCGEPLELELDVADLLIEPGEDARPLWHEVRHGGRTVRFRLPTGADQEHAALALADGVDESRVALDFLSACAESDAAEWPRELRALVSERMEQLDPQADLNLAFRCPACEREGSVPFDPGAYVLDELSDRADVLDEQVHVLAAAYGWTEDAILALPPARRGRYIELVEAR